MHTVLIAFAIVCEVLAAVNIGSPRFNLVAAGLAFFFVSLIVHHP